MRFPVSVTLAAVLLCACGDAVDPPPSEVEYDNELVHAFERWQQLLEQRNDAAAAFDAFLSENPDDAGPQHDILHRAWARMDERAEQTEGRFEELCEAHGLDPKTVERDLLARSADGAAAAGEDG